MLTNDDIAMTSDLTLPPDITNRINREIERDPRLKSEHTKQGYKADLAAFHAWRAGRPATKLLVEQYAAELQAEGKSPNTINRKLAAVRWYARRLADLAQEQEAMTEQEQRARAELVAQAERVASVSDVTGSRPIRGRHIAPGELGALLAICQDDPTPAGARDSAMIALAYAAGPRRAELTGLGLNDFTPPGEDEGELTIQGKGDKTRNIPIATGAYSALADWLKVRGSEPGPIFCAIGKGGKVKPDRRLSGEAMRLILDKRIEQAKIKPLTWHDFRRTFAGELWGAGIDGVTIKKLMGHSDMNTTGGYDRRGEEVKRKAIKTLHVPYRPRLV